MDQIQPYREHSAVPAPAAPRAAVPSHQMPPVAPAAPQTVAKTPADYLRAVRRRFWLVLAVAIPLGVLTSIWALRQPAIYQARADIRIETPELNPLLSNLVGRDIAPGANPGQNQYVPDRVAQLQSSGLAELVVGDPRVANDMNQFADPARELLNCLQVKSNWPKNSWNVVTIENRDPVLAKKLLEVLIDKFKLVAETESKNSIDEVRAHAETNLNNLKRKQQLNEASLANAIKENAKAIGPSGKNLFEEELVQHVSLLKQKEMRLGDIHQQSMMMQLFPKEMQDELDGVDQGRIAELEHEKRKLTKHLEKVKRTARNFNRDPAAREISGLLSDVMKELDEIRTTPVVKAEPRNAGDPTDIILDQYNREIESDRAIKDQLAAELRDSMPGFRKYQALEETRKELKEEIAEAEANIAKFDILSRSQHAPIHDSGNGNVKEPTVPVRPNRMISIAMGLFFSIGAGIALVCLLEHLDHRVKIPEHVSSGLSLPLLGVIPRIRRTPLVHRAGHLWTPGSPESLEADAFRNVRAGLLGVADRTGPIVTLLVTSAKAGEGKSTTALNLAATFAKAGERTVLVDIDLRRPSLGEVFEAEAEEDDDPKRGLVDVLRGDLPWQTTLRRTPIANLDFIPTGDTFDIPIEILGTRELRQLLLALSHHYDRVILDGPAVLGLADCLVLGRLVDSTLLVVRSGSHQLTTLFRAKSMLEQAHVPIAGVVFNSLTEGLDSWSSYVNVQAAVASGGPRTNDRRIPGPAKPRHDETDDMVSDDESPLELAGAGQSRRQSA